MTYLGHRSPDPTSLVTEKEALRSVAHRRQLTLTDSGSRLRAHRVMAQRLRAHYWVIFVCRQVVARRCHRSFGRVMPAIAPLHSLFGTEPGRERSNED
jgi:hypothetical protein